MKPINIFLFLALLSAAAALPVLDNTTPPPTAAQAEEPALINAASIPKIVIPPLPSAPHKPEQPPPVDAAEPAAQDNSGGDEAHRVGGRIGQRNPDDDVSAG